MLVCAIGDAHGEFDAMYAAVQSLEAEVGREVACILHVGDFGVWPDPEHLDEATRKHGDKGEFRRILAAGRVPRKTVFIAGNHEDFDYLTALRSREIVEGLEFLPWGEVYTLEHGGERLRVGGLGGCYGPGDYRKARVTGWARRHYLAADLARLAANADGGIDVLLTHEPPAGEFTECHAPSGFKRRSWKAMGEGQAELVASLRPRICLSGHLHARVERTVAGVRAVGLHKVPRRGCAVLMDIPEAGEVTDLAEWGGAPGRDVAVRSEEPSDDDPFGLRSLPELEERLARWSSAVLGGTTLDRPGRKRMHALLRDQPLRALLMGALTGTDLRVWVERELDPATRGVTLRRYLGAEIPDPAALRDADGLAKG